MSKCCTEIKFAGSGAVTHDQDHADEYVECRGTDASWEPVGDDSYVVCVNASRIRMV